MVNSRAFSLQCLCVSGKHSTGLFTETCLGLVLICHVDFCFASHKVHLSHTVKIFDGFVYVHTHVHTHVCMCICKSMRYHQNELTM